MCWEDAVWALSSVPGSQCPARTGHTPRPPALCHPIIPGEQGLLEAARLRKQQQQLCQAGSSSLLPAVGRRKKEENLAWIWPD